MSAFKTTYRVIHYSFFCVIHYSEKNHFRQSRSFSYMVESKVNFCINMSFIIKGGEVSSDIKWEKRIFSSFSGISLPVSFWHESWLNSASSGSWRGFRFPVNTYNRCLYFTKRSGFWVVYKGVGLLQNVWLLGKIAIRYRRSSSLSVVKWDGGVWGE